MNNIKVIAFDLWWVLIKENDYPLSGIAQILEKQFGKINNDEDYYNRAIKETSLSKEEIKNIVENTVENIYELREKDIFAHLPKVKLAIASNHISAIHKWLDKSDLKNKFDYIEISSDVWAEKPHKEFYERLILELKEKPENILFIDDNVENIEWAKKVGLSVLHYDRSKSLTSEILNYLQ